MKLATTFLLGLVVCFAVVNGKHHGSSDYDEKYDGQYPTEDPPTPKEESGPVEERAGGHDAKPGEETGEEAGGEDGGDGGDGGEETGGEEKPPKEHAKGMMGDTDAEKHKGYCHWEIGVWMKPGVSRRCGCMRCMCKEGGVWDCNYYFAYCPYFYCGNLIFSPHNQLCCCGKVHDKKAHYSCCGYNYYDMRHNKCCNYYSVRPAKSHCPRDRV